MVWPLSFEKSVCVGEKTEKEATSCGLEFVISYVRGSFGQSFGETSTIIYTETLTETNFADRLIYTETLTETNFADRLMIVTIHSIKAYSPGKANGS